MSSLLGAVADSVGRRLGNRAPVPFARRSAMFGSAGLARDDREAQMRAMGHVGTLFAIVNRLADSVAEVKWGLWRSSATGRDEDRAQVRRHAALTLLNKPNPFMRRRIFLETTQQHLELTGEGWWVVVRDELLGLPLELWPVRPDRMHPVPHPTEYLSGYIYAGPDGDRIPLRKEDVIFIRRPNPLDPYRGMGPVQSVLADIDSARYGAEWNRNFFINGAEPGGIVEVPESLDDDEFNLMVTRWREQHQGVANAHRVAVLERGTWKERKFSMRDMQFTELRSVSREMIREAYGFPKVMLGGADDINRANALAGEVMYARWLVQTRVELLKDVFNFDVLPMFGRVDNLQFRYETPIPESAEDADRARDSKASAWAALVTGGAHPDDASDAVGLPRMRTRAAEASGGDEADAGGDDPAVSRARDISEVIQKIYLGKINDVVTRTEARKIINQAGADLDESSE